MEEQIAFRVAHLTEYQDAAYATRYGDKVGAFEGALREAVAQGYHKVLSYKDEYEVARLLLKTREKAEAQFDGAFKMTHHMAPPLLSRKQFNGRPKKSAMPQLMNKAMPLLARMKRVRGTVFDVFGRTKERRMERELITQYEADLDEISNSVRPDTMEAAVALARLPLEMRGFGPVKQKNVTQAAKRREELLAVLRAAPLQSVAE